MKNIRHPSEVNQNCEEPEYVRLVECRCEGFYYFLQTGLSAYVFNQLNNILLDEILGIDVFETVNYHSP